MEEGGSGLEKFNDVSSFLREKNPIFDFIYYILKTLGPVHVKNTVRRGMGRVVVGGQAITFC